MILLLIQESPIITSGNQKWNGAAPILIRREVFKISEKYNINLKLYIKFNDKLIILNNKIVEARAWVIKYFIVASEVIILSVFLIRGIIESRLISNPIHIPNQEYDEIAIIVPNTKEE